MLRTAPCSCSSETWTTCEGMQVAWAKASTAVSSPTNSTVLVRSCSGVARGAAGGAVVAARGVLADEQPVGFFVADLGAYVLADVEHARHGWLLELGACGRAVPGS